MYKLMLLLLSLSGLCASADTGTVLLVLTDNDGDPVSGRLNIKEPSGKSVLEGTFNNGQTIKLPFGEYTADLYAPFVQSVEKNFEVSAEEGVLFIAGPKKLDDIPLQKVAIAIRLDMKKFNYCSPGHFLWVKLVGLYSTVQREQLVNRFGLAVFRDLEQGTYLLVLMDNKTIRSTTKISAQKSLTEVSPVPMPCK